MKQESNKYMKITAMMRKLKKNMKMKMKRMKKNQMIKMMKESMNMKLQINWMIPMRLMMKICKILKIMNNLLKK